MLDTAMIHSDDVRVRLRAQSAADPLQQSSLLGGHLASSVESNGQSFLERSFRREEVRTIELDAQLGPAGTSVTFDAPPMPEWCMERAVLSVEISLNAQQVRRVFVLWKGGGNNVRVYLVSGK